MSAPDNITINANVTMIVENHMPHWSSDVEYVRADLHTAVVAERDALTARNAELQGALSKAEVEARGLRNERDALRAVAEKWIDLAKRHNSTHAMKMDANRLADFMQGIRETEAALARSAP